MPESCVRCQKPGDAPPAHRIPFAPAVKEKVAASICASCWKEWEEMEIKVINEYRLNLLSPQGNQVYETHMKEFLGIEGT